MTKENLHRHVSGNEHFKYRIFKIKEQKHNTYNKIVILQKRVASLLIYIGNICNADTSYYPNSSFGKGENH